MDSPKLIKKHAMEVNLTLLKPLVKAYIFGHLSATGPRLLSVLFAFRKNGILGPSLLSKISAICLNSLASNRFPAFCASLVGGYTFLQIPLRTLVRLLATRLRKSGLQSTKSFHIKSSRFLASFVASWFSLRLLNSMSTEEPNRIKSGTQETKESCLDDNDYVESSQNQYLPKPNLQLVGKTMDLTLLAVVRAVEASVGSAWRQYRLLRPSSRNVQNSIESSISQLADAAIFAASAGAVMWAWIYLPDRLPRAYKNWIGQAAEVDPRLVQILRDARAGTFQYGQDTGEASILQGMCRENNWPLAWGDPAQTVPVPCEIVHMGTGPSCHWHAVSRFARSFKFAFAMYLPLQLLIKARHFSLDAFLQAFREAVRSSAFLSAFIALFYYSICLTRTILGPKIFSRNLITPQMWDSGLCIGAGCMMCGWSILIEAERRRQEIAFFVAPRAVATLLPRHYQRKHLWREQLAFSTSVGLLFTFAAENPRKIRGVLGSVIHGIIS